MKRILLMCILISNQVFATDFEQLTGIQGSDYQQLHSKAVDHDYHIFIKLPDQAKSEPYTKWPVVYLLDGGNMFPMLSPYADYLLWAKDLPPVILVGISYGTDDWRQGNNRSTDFTLPAKDREHYGGAALFHRFLSAELMPLIEAKYPADPKQRVLFGHSLGGQFGLYCAMFQPQTFSGIIASNPAIHRNLESFLVNNEATDIQPKLFIMQADNDDEVYQKPRQQWLAHWQDKPHSWQQKVMTAQGHNHMSSVPTAFRQGMMWLFSKPTTEPKQP